MSSAQTFFSSRPGSHLLAGLIVALIATLVAPVVYACGPPAPDPSDPCTRMKLWTPGETFPVNLEEGLRVRVEERENGYYGPGENIDTVPPPQVYRSTEDGWVEVESELVEQSNLVENARHLHLVDPRPGDHVVVWVDETCSETEPAVGEGRQIGTFTMTERVEFPDQLGTAALESTEVVTEEVYRGIAGDCSEVYADETSFYAHVAVELDPASGPWLDALETAIEVDGEVFRGFSRIGENTVEDGVYRTSIRHLCSASDTDELHNKLAEGTHRATILAKAGDLDVIRSTPVAFEIDCTPEPASEDPDAEIRDAQEEAEPNNDSAPQEDTPPGWDFDEGSKPGADSGCCSTLAPARLPAETLILLIALILTSALRRRR